MDTQYKALVEIGNLNADFDGYNVNVDIIKNEVCIIMGTLDIAFSFYKDESIIFTPTIVPLIAKITFLADDVKERRNEIMKGVFDLLKRMFAERKKDPLIIPFISTAFSG